MECIEALCYTRWDTTNETAGFSWKTTLDEAKADATHCERVQNLQTIWGQCENMRDFFETTHFRAFWMQGKMLDEWVYVGRITQDRDQYQRPSHRKEIWLFAPSVWKQLGASGAFLWEHQEWFTDLSTFELGEKFLANAYKTKKRISQYKFPTRKFITPISPPDWAENLVSALEEKEKGTHIISEEDPAVIFQVLRAFPAHFRLNYPTVTIGWHQRILAMTNQINLLFCQQTDYEKASSALTQNGGCVFVRQQPISQKAKNILNAMFPKTKNMYEQFSKPLEHADLEVLSPQQAVQEQQQDTNVARSSVATQPTILLKHSKLYQSRIFWIMMIVSFALGLLVSFTLGWARPLLSSGFIYPATVFMLSVLLGYLVRLFVLKLPLLIRNQIIHVFEEASFDRNALIQELKKSMTEQIQQEFSLQSETIKEQLASEIDRQFQQLEHDIMDKISEGSNCWRTKPC